MRVGNHTFVRALVIAGLSTLPMAVHAQESAGSGSAVSGGSTNLQNLAPGEQVKYWSVLLEPLLGSDPSKALMRQLLGALRTGDQGRIDALLQEAIETGTAASLIF